MTAYRERCSPILEQTQMAIELCFLSASAAYRCFLISSTLLVPQTSQMSLVIAHVDTAFSDVCGGVRVSAGASFYIPFRSHDYDK